MHGLLNFIQTKKKLHQIHGDYKTSFSHARFTELYSDKAHS